MREIKGIFMGLAFGSVFGTSEWREKYSKFGGKLNLKSRLYFLANTKSGVIDISAYLRVDYSLLKKFNKKINKKI